MCVFYLFADFDRTTIFSTFIFDDSVKLLRLFPIRLMQHDSHSHDRHSAHAYASLTCFKCLKNTFRMKGSDELQRQITDRTFDEGFHLLNI